MTQIQKTSDLSKFKKKECNRDINSGNLKSIISSIKAHNMLDLRPILVDENMEVIDGQHRLEAARILGVDIYYQIQKASHVENIILLNANQRRWSCDDYVHYYAKQGKEDYVKLQNYAKSKNLTLVTAFAVLQNHSAGRKFTALKSGTFKFPNEEAVKAKDKLYEQVEALYEVVKKYSMNENTFVKNKRTVLALLKLFQRPGFDFDIFIGKVSMKIDALRKCADQSAYYEMFRGIYNWKNSSPISGSLEE